MSSKEKSTTSSITNAFSFDEVIGILSGIDSKIISLHECSSDDFLGLNKQFKKFHTESKTISDNAGMVLDVITRDKSLQALRNLKILKEQLKKQIGHVEHFLSDTGNLIYSSISVIESSLLSFRNLRQNLTTIKFLIANLKLEATFNPAPQNETFVKEIFSTIEGIIAQIHFTEKFLLEIKKVLIENQDKLTALSGENYGALENSFKAINVKINKLVEIRQSALSAIPRLKQITEDCRENVSQIITNLQYHDIIKQKIDHIQLTHRNLVSELDDLKKNKNEDEKGTRHSYAKFFLKIRDIAGLQAAQLIHANKAYQNAIKEITTSLTSTGESMSDISQLCNQFVSKPELFDILNEKDLQLQLEDLSVQVNNDKDNIEELSGSIAMALRKIKELKKNHPAIQQSVNNLLNFLKSNIDNFVLAGKNENQQVINQIGSLINESEDIIGGIGANIENVSSSLFLINKTQSEFVNGRSVYLDRLYSTTYDLLSARGKSIADQLCTLQGNIKEGSEIAMSIRRSVDQVRYYDFFENVIEEIIDELNNINYRLRFIEAENQLADKNENLAHLRNHYTMESEHQIHDSYSKKSKAAIAVTSIDVEDKIDEEEDNLELF